MGYGTCRTSEIKDVMILKITSFAITVIFLTCGITNGAYAQILQGEKRVIFLKETPLLLYSTRDSLYLRFTPTVSEINLADSVIQNHISRQSYPGKLIEADQYFRQYAGVWQNGQRIIYINAACNKSDYFLQNTHYPMGGGRCYFKALVNITDRKLCKFYFNAPK